MESDKKSQKPVLPKDLFRNCLTWILYEIFKHYFPSVVSCTFCVITWVAFSMDASYQDVPGFYMIGRVVFDFAICFPLDGSIIRNRIPIRHCWFSKLNPCLYQEHIWNTPYFFYDGQRVQLNFRDNVLRPYLKGKFEGVADVNKIQSARFYLQSVNENFKLPSRNNLPESILNSELPRDTYRNKSTLHSRYLFMGFMYYRNGYRFMYSEMDVMKAMEFLAIITKVSPGKELDQWDQITKYTNQFLKGEIAAILGRYFSTDCFGPPSVGNSLVDGELKEIVEFTQPNVE
ncbi:hypothetical protein LQ764DRAFT_209540 [Zygosaccharomyces rouxii]|nr:hypothetical protein LQ764DRAFT_209540 [Zygosaccharomyces rouxii]